MSTTEGASKPPQSPMPPKDKPLSDSLDEIRQDAMPDAFEMREPTAERAVEILDVLKDQIDPEILAYFCHPNIVLTLAGARAQTEDYVLRPTEKDRAALELAAEKLQEYGIRLIIDDETDTRAGDDAEILGFFIIDPSVLDSATRKTSIPGIVAYSASSGVEGIRAWIQDCVRSLEEQSREGKLDPRISQQDFIHIAVGVAKGYPDKAILSFLIHNRDANEVQNVVHSDIPYADEYPCPQPNYSYGSEFSDDPEIVGHQQEWGKLLSDFYTSTWHHALKKDSNYKTVLTNHKRD